MAGNVRDDHLGVPQLGGGDPVARPRHGLVGDIGAKDGTVRSDAGRQLEIARRWDEVMYHVRLLALEPNIETR
jgi:hypothetical protein